MGLQGDKYYLFEYKGDKYKMLNKVVKQEVPFNLTFPSGSIKQWGINLVEIDGVFLKKFKQIYLFCGQKYYEIDITFDWDKKPPQLKARNIDDNFNISGPISAVYSVDGTMIFVKGNQYCEFDHLNRMVIINY